MERINDALSNQVDELMYCELERIISKQNTQFFGLKPEEVNGE
jgi:hypothetical protein